MKLEYAGQRPFINEHGIFFKDGKEDKYIYLEYAIDILIAISHDYEKGRNYSHSFKDHRLSKEEIINTLVKFYPNLEETINKEIKEYKLHLQEEKNQVKSSSLKDIEKEAFIKNLELMQDYKIQRAKNKIFYFHCIETIAKSIKKHKIKQIDAPFNEKFWHIFQTIEGELLKHRIMSSLKTVEKDSQLKATLLVDLF